MGRLIDITGNVYGRLYVNHRVKNTGQCKSNPYGFPTYECICKCGNTIDVRGMSLVNGLTGSCGCVRKEVVSDIKTLNISEQRFGRLVAKYPTNERIGHNVAWVCVCDCGNITKVGVSSLTTGNTKSCGCLQKECMLGESNPNWNPNLTDEDRSHNRWTPEYYNWVYSVYKRFEYTCQNCGKCGGNLNAHHKLNYSEYIDLRYDVDNGTCLCEDCHKKFHKIYGYKYNTPEQLEEYMLTNGI